MAWSSKLNFQPIWILLLVAGASDNKEEGTNTVWRHFWISACLPTQCNLEGFQICQDIMTCSEISRPYATPGMFCRLQISKIRLKICKICNCYPKRILFQVTDIICRYWLPASDILKQYLDIFMQNNTLFYKKISQNWRLSYIGPSEPMQNDQRCFFSNIYFKFYNIIK